jgi:hypothetical protein
MIQPDKPKDTAIEMPHIFPIAQSMKIGFEPIKDIQIVSATLSLDSIEAAISICSCYTPPDMACSKKKLPKLALHIIISHIINRTEIVHTHLLVNNMVSL